MRRDRINSSLQEMKNLVLEALKKDVSTLTNILYSSFAKFRRNNFLMKYEKR